MCRNSVIAQNYDLSSYAMLIPGVKACDDVGIGKALLCDTKVENLATGDTCHSATIKQSSEFDVRPIVVEFDLP